MKNKIPKLKLPAEVVETLRKRGGAHSSKKGAKGYDRKKSNWRLES